MAKKHKKARHKHSKEPSPPSPQRIANARAEGRFQFALELTRLQYKRDPTEANLQLLREVTLERGQQLLNQGQSKEAANLFRNALDMGGTAEIRASAIQRLAACGGITTVLPLLPGIDDPKLLAGVWGHIADQAVSKPNEVRQHLPAEMQAQLDAVLAAFACLEKSDDEGAKQQLGVIGLQSPFLEWRVLARGFLAFYAGDDPRACDNWQRLDPHRLPARLAAPFRVNIDSSYAQAQSHETKTQLRAQLARLEGNVAGKTLHSVQALLANKEKSLAQAFRIVEGIVPVLRKEDPHIFERLRNCFRWIVIRDGLPEDIKRLDRVFTPNATDPHWLQLSALAMEERGYWDQANELWQGYDRGLAEQTNLWPAGQLAHARGMLWNHMGKNASEHAGETIDGEYEFDDSEPMQFEPSAEVCFQRSLEFVPDALATHEALFRHHLKNGKRDLARKAGESLLQHHPEHAPTLEALADLATTPNKALTLLRQALRVNPLKRDLRRKTCDLHQQLARKLSSQGKFDDARANYSAALGFNDTPRNYPLLIVGATIEFKAGAAEAHEELVREAEKLAGHALPVLLSRIAEGLRQGITPAQKKPLTRELNESFKQCPAPGAVLELVRLMSLNKNFAYTGQKTHQSKILGFVKKTPLNAYAESDLESLSRYLGDLQARTHRENMLLFARRAYPDNAGFVLDQLEDLLSKKRQGFLDSYRMPDLLDAARQLITDMPRGEAQELLRNRLNELEKRHNEVYDPFAGNPFFSLLGGGMFDPDFGDDEDSPF